MAMQSSIWDEIRNTFQKTDNTISKIIIVNGAVFILFGLIRLFLFFTYGIEEHKEIFSKIVDLFTVPADLSALLYKPWSLVTYMFFHTGIWHIGWNMLILFWFGKILSNFVGTERILSIYVYGGLAGALVFILVYNLSPVFQNELWSTMLGASAGVLAIVLATATIVPNYNVYVPFLGPIKLKYIAAFIVVLNFVNLPLGNYGGTLAHLGGALAGYLFIKQLQKGSDWSKRFNRFTGSLVGAFSSKKTMRVKHKKARAGKGSTFAENSSKQERIDSILDKIAQSGYDSLTAEEKEFLFKVSKED